MLFLTEGQRQHLHLHHNLQRQLHRHSLQQRHHSPQRHHHSRCLQQRHLCHRSSLTPHRLWHLSMFRELRVHRIL